MTTVRKFVSKLNEDVCIAILAEHEEFENNGFIGNSELRRQTTLLMAELGTADNVTLWMREIVNEIYRCNEI
jgi:hypothetical protein